MNKKKVKNINPILLSMIEEIKKKEFYTYDELDFLDTYDDEFSFASSLTELEQKNPKSNEYIIIKSQSWVANRGNLEEGITIFGRRPIKADSFKDAFQKACEKYPECNFIAVIEKEWAPYYEKYLRKYAFPNHPWGEIFDKHIEG